MATHLVWFRHDLRLSDNLALHAACRDSKATVLALYIVTPAQWQQHDMSARQAEFIFQHLTALGCALAERGIPLYIHQLKNYDAAIEGVKLFCEQHHVDALFYNYQYELNERKRDRKLEKLMDPHVICQGFDDSVLLPPGSVSTGEGQMYKVFTPFYKAFIERLQQNLPECVPAPEVRGDSLSFASFDFEYPRWAIDPHEFPVGEKMAIGLLRRFCRQPVADYPQQRDFPGVEGTSRLSAYLAIGVLSPRQCLQRLLKEHPRALEGEGGATWLKELIWREFYRHLMVAYPALCCHRPFLDWTARIRWKRGEHLLIAWQKGMTGYPIVDAAMRQLNQTGWMHNRLRMMVASFLVKDLLIDWREGERYFMSQLIDGDLAANNGGWQWAASTGTDAVPYFRIFNPTTQGERFDAEGRFIRKWLPELAHIPTPFIHTPWAWADKYQQVLDYPRPIIDHKQARIETLAAYEMARRNKRE